jgi:hypothetical protein
MLVFWSCSNDHAGVTAGPESQRGNHCRTREPTWSSLHDQKVNVVITTGLENQRGHHYRNLAFWSCSDDHVGFLVLQ